MLLLRPPFPSMASGETHALALDMVVMPPVGVYVVRVIAPSGNVTDLPAAIDGAAIVSTGTVTLDEVGQHFAQLVVDGGAVPGAWPFIVTP